MNQTIKRESDVTLFWLRDEVRPTERRAPLGPKEVARLRRSGDRVVVERSSKRVFADDAYGALGCDLVPAGSWTEAPKDAVILGLKELPDTPSSLHHRFIHFAHLYKEQTGWADQIARFERGGGSHFDIEYLTNARGRRIAAFGFWAGWMGAALAAWRYYAKQLGEPGPEAGLASFASRAAVERILTDLAERVPEKPRALVVGAKGRSGQGAIKALRSARIKASDWEKAETRDLDRETLLSHEILVNCVMIDGPGLLLVNHAHLAKPATRLEMIADVSCDPLSDFNPLPLYEAPTSWEAPFLQLGPNGQGSHVELTAIDNLPSLLPKEASEDFAAQLVPALERFPDGIEWQASLSAFDQARTRCRTKDDEQKRLTG